MAPRKKKNLKTYEGLLSSLRELIAEAKAKGVPLFERDDCLECRHCGCYEDVLATGDGRFQTFLADGKEIPGIFIVIDKTEQKERMPDKVRFTITYWFICPSCGVYQNNIFRSEFDDSIFK